MRGRYLLERENILAPLLLFPVVMYVVLLVGFPFVMAFVYGFSNVTVGNPDYKIIGIRNFIDIIGDEVFQKSLGNTFIFTFVSISIVLILSHILAEVLLREFRGKWLVRFLVMLPWTAPIALGTIGYLWFLDSVFSPIDWLLRSFGLLGSPDAFLGPMSNMYWLGRPGLAMASIYFSACMAPAASWNRDTHCRDEFHPKGNP